MTEQIGEKRGGAHTLAEGRNPRSKGDMSDQLLKPRVSKENVRSQSKQLEALSSENSTEQAGATVRSPEALQTTCTLSNGDSSGAAPGEMERWSRDRHTEKVDLAEASLESNVRAGDFSTPEDDLDQSSNPVSMLLDQPATLPLNDIRSPHKVGIDNLDQHKSEDGVCITKAAESLTPRATRHALTDDMSPSTSEQGMDSPSVTSGRLSLKSDVPLGLSEAQAPALAENLATPAKMSRDEISARSQHVLADGDSCESHLSSHEPNVSSNASASDAPLTLDGLLTEDSVRVQGDAVGATKSQLDSDCEHQSEGELEEGDSAGLIAYEKNYVTKLPSTRLAFVANDAIIDAAITAQRIYRGVHTRRSLLKARDLVLRAIGENEDVRERARLSAQRAKRDAQRELNARIQNMRRKISDAEAAINYASTKHAKVMRRDVSRMRRELEDLNKMRAEVEQAKLESYSAFEIKLAKPLSMETDVALTLSTLLNRDGSVRVRCALTINIRCDRADTISQLRERAALRSCGILRGTKQHSQIRGLVIELRAVELQQLMVRQLVRQGMPRWWAWPPACRQNERNLLAEREKNWRAAMSQYDKLLEDAREALMAAVDRLLRQCITRAMHARRRRAELARKRQATALHLQCAWRVCLARKLRAEHDKRTSAAIQDALQKKRENLWKRVRDSVANGLRDHREYQRMRMSAITIGRSWRIAMHRRAEALRMREQAKQHLAASRIGRAWQDSHQEERRQLARVKAREAKYQREVKRSRALLREAERLQREAEEKTGGRCGSARAPRAIELAATFGVGYSEAASHQRLSVELSPGRFHDFAATFPQRRQPHAPTQPATRSPSSRTRKLSDGVELTSWADAFAKAEQRDSPASASVLLPVRPSTGRALHSGHASRMTRLDVANTPPDGHKVQGGVCVSVRRLQGDWVSGAVPYRRAVSARRPKAREPPVEVVPSWADGFDMSLHSNITSPSTQRSRAFVMSPGRTTAHGLLTERAVVSRQSTALCHMRDVPPPIPGPHLTAAQHAVAESIALRLKAGHALMVAELHMLKMAHEDLRRRQQAPPSPRGRQASQQPPMVQTPRARHQMAVADARALWRMVENPPPNSIIAAAEPKTLDLVQRYAVPPPPCRPPGIEELDLHICLFSESDPDAVSAERALAKLWKDSRLQHAVHKHKREQLLKWRDDWRRWTAGSAMRRRLLAAEEAHQARLRAADEERHLRMRRWLWEDRASLVMQRAWRSLQRRRQARRMALEASIAFIRKQSELEALESERKRLAALEEEHARQARLAEEARRAEEEKPVDWNEINRQISGLLDTGLSAVYARKAEFDAEDRRLAEEERCRQKQELEAAAAAEAKPKAVRSRKSMNSLSYLNPITPVSPRRSFPTARTGPIGGSGRSLNRSAGSKMEANVLQFLVLPTRPAADQLRERIIAASTTIVAMLKEWDEDNSGGLSKKEFRRAVRGLGFNGTSEDINAVFDSLDLDGDGEVEYQRLPRLLKLSTAAAPELRPENESELRQFSQNRRRMRKSQIAARDAKLLQLQWVTSRPVADQLREALAAHKVAAMSVFRQLDDDSSGSISRGEFRKALRAMGYDGSDADADIVFTSFVPDASNLIEHQELDDLLRRSVELAPELTAGSTGIRSQNRVPSRKSRVRAEDSNLLDVELVPGRPVAEQLRDALAAKSAAVMALFREWDDDASGTVDKKEFRKAMRELGFSGSAEEVDAFFNSMDPDSAGEIEYRDFRRLLKQTTHST